MVLSIGSISATEYCASELFETIDESIAIGSWDASVHARGHLLLHLDGRLNKVVSKFTLGENRQQVSS